MAGEPSSTKRTSLAAAAVGLIVVLVIGFIWWQRPAQIGGTDEAFKAVDALFTAITARDAKLLGQCEQRIHALKGRNELRNDASDFLDTIIAKARENGWELAAANLYDFMKAQRR